MIRRAVLARGGQAALDRLLKQLAEFDEFGRMKPSSYYDRIADVMEELVRFTVLMRPHARQLVNRYSERKAAGNYSPPEIDPAGAVLGRT